MIKGFSRLSKLILSLKKKILKISYKILAELKIFQSYHILPPPLPLPFIRKIPEKKVEFYLGVLCISQRTKLDSAARISFMDPGIRYIPSTLADTGIVRFFSP